MILRILLYFPVVIWRIFLMNLYFTKNLQSVKKTNNLKRTFDMCNSVIIWLSMYFCGFKFMAGIMHKRCFFIISIPFSWHFFRIRYRTGSIRRLARGPRSQRSLPFCRGWHFFRIRTGSIRRLARAKTRGPRGCQSRLFWRGRPWGTSCTPKRITPSTRHVWYKLKSSLSHMFTDTTHLYVWNFALGKQADKTEIIFRQRFQLLF